MLFLKDLKTLRLAGIILISGKCQIALICRKNNGYITRIKVAMLIIFWHRVCYIWNRWNDQQAPVVALIADQRVRLCNGRASSALPDRCISLAIFDPIFDRFHVTPNKVLATRSNDISALCTNKVMQPLLRICG